MSWGNGARKRKSKYGASRAKMGGRKFDSRREMRRFADLQILEGAGEIRDLRHQVPIALIGQNGPILTPTGRHAKYIADFKYYDLKLKAWVIEDAKGYPTPEYKLKRAILAAMGLEILET